MSDTPTLPTERLTLVPFSERHLSARYVGWLNDPEVVRYSEQRHRKHTMETCRQYFDSLSDTPSHFWAIEAKDADLGHIGNITATVDTNNEVADVAIILGESAAWDKGYGTEAWAEVCRYLLQDTGMRKVSAGTMACNDGMLAIMRKTGMAEECRRPRQFLLDGEEIDVVYVALYRDPAADGAL